MTSLNKTLADDRKTIAALSALAAAEEAGAPAPDAAAAPEPAPMPEPAPEPAPKMVPLSALQEERAGRRVLRERLAAMDDRFRQFMAARAAQAAQVQAQPPVAPPAPKPPTYDENPTAHLKAESEATKQTVEQIRAALAQRQLAELQTAAREQFVDRYHGAARDFAARVPDFGQAYAHACADRDAELAELGYADPMLRRQIVEAEEMAIAGRAMAEGVNPAERIYKLARRRGYRGTGESDARAKLEALARGQAAARSLSGVGGATPMPPRLEELANMSDEDFGAATKNVDWRRLLRG